MPMLLYADVTDCERNDFEALALLRKDADQANF